MTGLVVAGLAVVVALALGGVLTLRRGRFRSRTGPATGSVLAGTRWADGLGERATLLQFSSAFCAPCRVTRERLRGVADLVPGVAHVEVDAENDLDLVRRLGILRTPTTLLLDHAGREVGRASGTPTTDRVLASLEPIVSGSAR